MGVKSTTKGLKLKDIQAEVPKKEPPTVQPSPASKGHAAAVGVDFVSSSGDEEEDVAPMHKQLGGQSLLGVTEKRRASVIAAHTRVPADASTGRSPANGLTPRELAMGDKTEEATAATSLKVDEFMAGYPSIVSHNSINEVRISSLQASLREDLERCKRYKKWPVVDTCNAQLEKLQKFLAMGKAFKAWSAGRIAHSDTAGVTLSKTYAEFAHVYENATAHPFIVKRAVFVELDARRSIRKQAWVECAALFATAVVQPAGFSGDVFRELDFTCTFVCLIQSSSCCLGYGRWFTIVWGPEVYSTINYNSIGLFSLFWAAVIMNATGCKFDHPPKVTRSTPSRSTVGTSC